MPVDPNRLTKPVRKLRKAIKKPLEGLTPDQVHSLRTQCRRLEAALHALKLDGTKPGRHLLQCVTPIRKAAGKVRDMDVLTGLAAWIACNREDLEEDRVQLLEALGARRIRFEKRLRRVIGDHRRRALRSLKRASARIDEWIRNERSNSADDRPGGGDPAVIAMSQSWALSASANLNRINLHSYRKQVKQLRYVLELARGQDETLLEMLGQTKDRIGEWHDWCELEALACKLLGARKLVRQIHSHASERFEEALRAASGLQRRHFQGEKQKGGQPRSPELKKPILVSAARLGA